MSKVIKIVIKSILWIIYLFTLIAGISVHLGIFYMTFGFNYDPDPNGGDLMYAFWFGVPFILISFGISFGLLLNVKNKVKYFILAIPLVVLALWPLYIISS